MATAYELVIDNAKIQIHCNELSGVTRETIILDPFDQTDGEIAVDLNQSQDLFGGTGATLSDGDDATGVYLTSQTQTSPSDLTTARPVAVYFKVPTGFTPEAFALRIRAKSGPYADQENYNFNWRLGSVTTPGLYGHDSFAHGTPVGGTGYVPFLSDLMYLPGVSTLTQHDFWWGEIDPLNPTDPGGWWEIAVDGDGGLVADLQGDGLRIDLGVDEAINPADHNVHQVIRLSEVKLLVHGHY